ncbi:type II toxin-antitoxin system RelE/ParE family toxin [Vibrio sp. SS-MA-C1-2]|uniref:type II toxin-antitoxin system RelE/ParE family toxin n=1 Tax=Vibrio sp. SS-MA-C1-2 TaxID=2908646 RepID=UPI001F36AD1F|nr:type II toxin-antitoxin system RelE/ParE family toxin [Vibrio sp. SS-MA-C1-2]UJF16830.1 type II toxin-antitoxin system RelE/ParE family toxin [Vibrio sp. SS-MA-C1-2]
MMVQVYQNSYSSKLTTYLMNVPVYHRDKIVKKLQQCQEVDDKHHIRNLKVLKNRIWHYKGTIYKLRVDSVGISSRVLFCVKKERLILLHAFTKTTAKTPSKEGKLAVRLFQLWQQDESCVENLSFMTY